MFEAYMKNNQRVVTVYAVDIAHDAFLIGYNNRFRWVSMDNFEPYECADEDAN